MKIIDIKNFEKEVDFKPSRMRGQNFLIDKNILDKIVWQADIKSTDNILEVGPGLGFLTEKLLVKTTNILAIELDKKLFKFLQDKFKENKNIKLINKDILKLEPKELKQSLLTKNKKYRIIANLPYSISSNFIRKFLEFDYLPTDMILMLQKEVAERMIAQAGDMSVLSIATQLYSQPKILFKVKPGSFYPAPKVDSAIIHLRNIKPIKAIDTADFFLFVKAGFSAKRKKLVSNLVKNFKKKVTLAKLTEAFAEMQLSSNVRAQELTVDEWIELYKKVA